MLEDPHASLPEAHPFSPLVVERDMFQAPITQALPHCVMGALMSFRGEFSIKERGLSFSPLRPFPHSAFIFMRRTFMLPASYLAQVLFQCKWIVRKEQIPKVLLRQLI